MPPPEGDLEDQKPHQEEARPPGQEQEVARQEGEGGVAVGPPPGIPLQLGEQVDAGPRAQEEEEEGQGQNPQVGGAHAPQGKPSHPIA